jgi:hypothetical protein
VQENREKADEKDTKLPESNKQSVNFLFILILVCWLLLLYFYGRAKGPG